MDRREGYMKKFYILLAVFLLSAVQLVSAATKAEADQAYQENKFADAIAAYETILGTEGESADIYYNLGNCYYKTKNIAKAVLNYERALLLNPGDADIRFNLELARSKTVDQITPASEVFIVAWMKNITNLMSEKEWGVTALVSFLLLLLGLALYIFGNRIVLKKVGFVGAIVFLIMCVSANLFARGQKNKIVNRTGAIVMSPTITVKSTPNESGTDLFVLHEGTKIYIQDNSMKGWKEIRLEDGKEGWLPASAIEVI
ncbi:Tetratricopeptide TPR_1 repeat-containing protein [Phocaeicola salanitronis DSM 18170]|jgi:tetratricopeptide (TPR) repeat protein|uniref:Tetratricopeptide TPR_1 repeat-containing protein n=2 Tax=Phocaeicola salanitronis TaxID=376805 RepID=F0R022_PHOSB|nr:Tetratricopeptide TPR_1 repeat-containing protein [Phocaeicola salanitronis DSM 18170]